MIDRTQCTARKHGDRNAYSNHGCRCADAREDKRRYHKRIRHGLQVAATTDSTGVARRLQALVFMGYDEEDLAERLGWYRNRVSQAVWRRNRTITLQRHREVADLFAALCHVPGPSERARRRAERKGFQSPLAWEEETIDDPNAEPVVPDFDESLVDEVAVARFINGEALSLTRAEKREAARRMYRRGFTKNAIAERLGLSWWGVRRVLEEVA